MSAMMEEPFVGEDGYYHYLYRVTNTKNGMIYIGIHSTDDLDDDYMGSGTFLREEQEKYGLGCFKKEILEFFDSREELSYREWEIVDEEFVQRSDTYNLVRGGGGAYNCLRNEVQVLDLDGNNVYKFSSGKEAAKYFGIKGISYYLNRNEILQEKFVLVSEPRISNKTREKIAKSLSKPIRLLDLEGNVLQVFPSRKDVEKYFGVKSVGYYLNKNRVFRGQFFLVSDFNISEMTRKKMSSSLSIPVNLLDIEGNVLQVFPSRKDVEKYFGMSSINHYLNKNRVFRGQYLLVSDSVVYDTTKKKLSASLSIPVRVLDLEGNELQVFSSGKDAENYFGLKDLSYYLNKNRVFRGQYLLVSDNKTSESTKKKWAASLSVPVRVLDLEGNEVQKFSSRKEAAEHFGMSSLNHYINKSRIFKKKYYLVTENQSKENS